MCACACVCTLVPLCVYQTSATDLGDTDGRDDGGAAGAEQGVWLAQLAQQRHHMFLHGAERRCQPAAARHSKRMYTAVDKLHSNAIALVGRRCDPHHQMLFDIAVLVVRAPRPTPTPDAAKV
jgi:hypothetical protein